MGPFRTCDRRRDRRRHLSPAARAEVEALLGTEGAKSMAEVSLWADLIKALRIPDQPSHVVRLPLDRSGYDPATVCKRNRCLVAAIDTYAAVLADRTNPATARVTALKYLIHLVGDLHQPLHASADTGARAVVLHGTVTTLHDVWDDAIVDSRGKDRQALVDVVEAASMRPETGSTPADWALEGRDIARDTIFEDPRLETRRRDVLPWLPKTYLDDNWPIARDRLKEGGYRLAALLDRILANGGAAD
ncbi:S1/P1 nuclease [Mesorhizobium sp. LHD-90]|uniref:S1/P1 nuclease n=1 Tax=Mesorhizobium sp. LHD-90 TaxID=3071414 RepID=UPI0027E08C74|nr:S1/P1 nuclease [Mesorhizobium sp. LHD-90]MDQ6434301.1 S1/P1 nuclease [Mesorhizobium sp. LHD-90]